MRGDPPQPDQDASAAPPAGTRNDLLADAAALGLPLTDRQITEWRRLGLLGAPRRQRNGPHGQDLALFSPQQRALFGAVARSRAKGVSNPGLATIPVYAWMSWGDDWVTLEQLRAAMSTAIGGKVGRSERVAGTTAGILLEPINVNGGSISARAALRKELAQELQNGRIDRPQLRQLARALFEPQGIAISRGPAQAPLTVDAIVLSLGARIRAARHLSKFTDDQFLEARLQHLASWHEYQTVGLALQREGGDQLADIFRGFTLSETVSRSVATLLLLLGMNLDRDQRRAAR